MLQQILQVSSELGIDVGHGVHEESIQNVELRDKGIKILV